MKKLLCVLLTATVLLLPVEAVDEPKYIALTFDDGPSGYLTADLLDGLAERGVHATFFICGYRVDQFPEITARIAAEGHEIGVHGDTHTMFSQMSPIEVCDDLSEAMRKIEEASGVTPTLLRPPGGIYDLEVLKKTVCADLPVILWSVDVEDWHRSNSDEICADIVKQVQNGDVILLHDMKESSVNAALKVIDRLQSDGYVFVTVSELARLSGTELAGNTAYYAFRFAKNASISDLEAETEPCAKLPLPPPRPCRSVLRQRTKSRRSPSERPTA